MDERGVAIKIVLTQNEGSLGQEPNSGSFAVVLLPYLGQNKKGAADKAYVILAHLRNPIQKKICDF